MKRERDLTSKRVYAGMSPEQARAADAEHQQILKVLTGLLLTLFVAMVANTIVGNALPVIVAEIGGTQQQYTWIITAAILASTAVTPIAGKLADLTDKKKLLLFAMGLFTLGSLLSGAATSAAMLIGVRVLQGLGMGALQVLVQIIIATIIPPRQRGRYNGYMGAVIAVATVSGPLLGGIIVDVPWLGWRWCYWSAVPFMVFAMYVTWRNLKVPAGGRPGAKVDWLGAALISIAATVLLVWVSFADHEFPWGSWQTAVMLGVVVLAAVLFVLVERRAEEPVVPISIITERTTVLAIIASLAVGTVMFGANVFLGQYFQIGRGYSPTVSGWLGLPLMLGLLISSTLAGRLVTATGRWKPYVVGGSALLAVGIGLMATVGATTSLVLIGVYLFVAGIGLGASMQNLVLAVQNTVPVSDVGAATSTVTFFRTLGGATGIQVLGALYALRVTDLARDRLAAQGLDTSAIDASTSSLDLSQVPEPVAGIITTAYGDGIGIVFTIAAAAAVLGLVAVSFMRGTELRNTWDVPADSRRVIESDAGPGTVAAPGDVTPATTAAVDQDGGRPADEAAGRGGGAGATAVTASGSGSVDGVRDADGAADSSTTRPARGPDEGRADPGTTRPAPERDGDRADGTGAAPEGWPSTRREG
ncbi:MFS transporter [Georgenia sp. TF02-10]|uniref:MDR family MFS transporter n=1 Tax=Georgenia sp. TF02-10 TaxID=2917725 RepID=UPI001FA714C7|nr:MDR family MFS transporter [Georgenia sp. TF02-10]UNX55193.1 MFS transporter [Georgenia sp. TF02-10]